PRPRASPPRTQRVASPPRSQSTRTQRALRPCTNVTTDKCSVAAPTGRLPSDGLCGSSGSQRGQSRDRVLEYVSLLVGGRFVDNGLVEPQFPRELDDLVERACARPWRQRTEREK